MMYSFGNIGIDDNKMVMKGWMYEDAVDLPSLNFLRREESQFPYQPLLGTKISSNDMNKL